MRPFSSLFLLLIALAPPRAFGDEILHVVSTGQSLSQGNAGCPAITTTQPYSNLMLSGSVFVPLIENTICNTNGALKQESPASGLGNIITAINGSVMEVTRHGVGGVPYANLKKGTAAYTSSIAAVTTSKGLAVAAGRSYKVVAVDVVHGESDWTAGNGVNYKNYLYEWQSDYESDINAATGQTGRIPLITDQMSSWAWIAPQGGPCYTGDASGACATFSDGSMSTTIAQWVAARDSQKILLAGPKYQYDYIDGTHLMPASYHALGELHGKVLARYLATGAWRPLSPRSITRAGAVIAMRCWVPAGVLAIDTTHVAQRTNYGFTFWDDSGATPAISSVAVSGDTVTVTLAATPTGANQRLRYAFKATRYTSSGAANGGAPGGNIRDTDTTVGLAGDPLYDWMIAFDEPVGFTWEPNFSSARAMGGFGVSGGVGMR